MRVSSIDIPAAEPNSLSRPANALVRLNELRKWLAKRGREGANLLALSSRRMRWAAIFTALLACALALPTSFIVEGAGPALNVNGQVNSQKLLHITGAPTYSTRSRLYLTTVSAWGNADSGVTGLQALKALVSDKYQLYPVRALYPAGATAAQIKKADTADMNYSQDTAQAVASSLAGLPVKEKLTVANVAPNYPAASVLQAGDEILGIRSLDAPSFTPVANFMDLAQYLAQIPAGGEVDLRLRRKGAVTQVRIGTAGAPADRTGWIKPGAMIGAQMQVSDLTSPVTVTYAIDNIGGPSAGLMFTLGIYDALTEGSLAGDSVIAGTGTIAWNGDVGAIGGIEHKLQGAARAGATDFLAPAENCAETIGHTPPAMNVWAVRTAREAVTAVQAIAAGDTSQLTACSAVPQG